MPNASYRQDNGDSKEIRLFGDKSIKEEAYRQKILKLEKEVMRLEAVIEHQQKKIDAAASVDIEKDKKPPEYFEGLFYETALSLDEKIKSYRNALEAEKVKPANNNVLNKKAFVVLLVFAAIALIAAISASSAFIIFKLGNASYQSGAKDNNIYEKPEYIRKFLQESGLYNKQYTIINMDAYNSQYKGIVELHFEPYNKWTLKMLAADIIENFKRVSIDKPLQLKFFYEGKNYATVDFSPILNETHYNFLA